MVLKVDLADSMKLCSSEDSGCLMQFGTASASAGPELDTNTGGQTQLWTKNFQNMFEGEPINIRMMFNDVTENMAVKA